MTETVLHVLCRATPSDARPIIATCGHDCVGSQKTHDLLATPEKHIIYCLPCFMEKTEEKNSNG